MNEVKRYGVTESYGLGDMREETQGEYIRYEDYARLKADVERLTKAGDAMAKVLGKIRSYNGNEGRWCSPCEPELLEDWLKAKEVQS